MGYRWRSIFICFMFVVSFIGVLVRLYLIQIEETRSFSLIDQEVDLIELARSRQNREMVIHSGRGQILDRSGQVLVGGKGWQVLAFPQTEEQIDLRRPKFERLAQILGYDATYLQEQLLRFRRPMLLYRGNGKDPTLSLEEKKVIEELKIPGISVVESDQRMTFQQIGQQVIGQIVRSPVLMQNWYPDEVKNGRWSTHSMLGISGLEKAFEPFLHGEEEHVLVYTAMLGGKPLNGVEVDFHKKESGIGEQPYSIVTTLDKDIQGMVEQILRNEQVTDGAVVVQDIRSGDILAMASQPDELSAQEEENPWENKALMEATPGSIFKTVVAVAAINEGIVHPDSLFSCDGYWEAFQLSDANGKGHGKQTFEKSFANSCNLALGQAAIKLGGEKIEAYAKQLGLGQKVIWRGKVFHDPKFVQLPQEQTGLIFAHETPKNDPGVLVQTGIGQRDVRITPIQAANMITSFFHGGKTLMPRIVTEIRDFNGQTIFQFHRRTLPTAKSLKPSTLNAIKNMMRMVVTEGTASSLKQSEWPLAGKTGTAQIGLEKNRYNKWMIGYGPTDQPRYSVAVVLRNVHNSDDSRAQGIFLKVMEGIKEIETKRKNP